VNETGSCRCVCKVKWSCGSAVKIENHGGAAIECARCRDDGGWMRERCATELLFPASCSGGRRGDGGGGCHGGRKGN